MGGGHDVYVPLSQVSFESFIAFREGGSNTEYRGFDKYEGKLFLLFKGNEREERGGGKLCFVETIDRLDGFIEYKLYKHVSTLYRELFYRIIHTRWYQSILRSFILFHDQRLPLSHHHHRWIKNVAYPRWSGSQWPRDSILLIIIINARIFFHAYQNSINYLEFDLHCRCGRSLAVIIDFARPWGKCGITAWNGGRGHPLSSLLLLPVIGSSNGFDCEEKWPLLRRPLYTCSTLDRVGSYAKLAAISHVYWEERISVWSFHRKRLVFKCCPSFLLTFRNFSFFFFTGHGDKSSNYHLCAKNPSTSPTEIETNGIFIKLPALEFLILISRGYLFFDFSLSLSLFFEITQCRG